MASLSTRTSARGTVSYRVNFRHNGKQRQVSFVHPEGQIEFGRMIDQFGVEYALRNLEARDARAEHMPTLTEFTERYLDIDSGLLTGITDGTREGYVRAARRSFLVVLGNLPVDAIERDDIGRWIAWQQKQTVVTTSRDPNAPKRTTSPKTIANHHALLSNVLKVAVEKKLREDNPAFRMRLPKGVREEPVFLSPAEFHTILHFLEPAVRPLVYFLATTGTRWGEATAVQWGDVVDHGDVPVVRISRAWKRAAGSGSVLSTPKTARGRRTISLPAETLRLLGVRGRADAFVFTGLESGDRIWRSVFERQWKRAIAKAMSRAECAEAGLVPLVRAPRVHDLRHTHASWLIAQGMPLPYVQARLGHESITTTVHVYGHLVSDAHQMLANAITETLAASTVTAAVDAGNARALVIAESSRELA